MRNLSLLMIFVSCCASSAFAQDKAKTEFFAGFSVNNISGASAFGFGASDRDTAIGFDNSVTFYFNKRFGIEGDVDGHFGKTRGILGFVCLSCPPPIGFKIRYSSYNFVAGPHVRLPIGKGKITPFVRALVGGNHFRVRNIGTFDDSTRSETNFALKLGGGVDFGISKNTAVRLSTDYNPVFVRDSDIFFFRRHSVRNNVVFSIGLVVK